MKIIHEILKHQKNRVIILAILGFTIFVFVLVMTVMVGSDRYGGSGDVSNQLFHTLGTTGIAESPETYITAIWTYKTAGPVQSVSVSSIGQYIAAGSGSMNVTTGYMEGEISLFTNNGTLLWNQKPKPGTTPVSAVKSVAVNADGRSIAALGLYGDLMYFDRMGTPLWMKGPMGSIGENVVISSNGRYIVSGSGGVVSCFNRTGVLQWGYDTRHPGNSSASQGYANNHVALSSDGQHIAAASENGQVYYFDPDGYLLWSKDTGNPLENIAINSYGRYIAVASRDHNVYYFDDSGNRLWNYTTGGIVRAVAMNDDGQYVAVGSEDSAIYLFNRNGTLLWKYSTGAPVESVSMSHNGNTLAAGSDDHIIYCFNQTGSLLWKYPTGGEVKTIAVSADENFIAAGSYDGSVYFFNRLGTRRVLKTTEIHSELKNEMKNTKYPGLPEPVNAALYQLNKEKPFVVNRWEVDEKQKHIIIYVVWMSARRFDEPQNTKIEDWNVTIVPDTGMMSELKTVRAEMMQLEQDPDMQLASHTLSVGNGRIEIFVYLYNYTPANRELLKNGLRGWKIDGGPVATPPPSPATTTQGGATF